MTRTIIYPILIIILVFPNSCLIPTARADPAYSYLVSAENQIATAYYLIKMAEREGADIKHLVVDLNNATNYLSLAKIQFSNGDSLKTIENALRSIYQSNAVVTDATSIRSSAINDAILGRRQKNFRSRMMVLIVIISFMFIWTVFKKYYEKRIMRMQVENVHYESQ